MRYNNYISIIVLIYHIIWISGFWFTFHVPIVNSTGPSWLNRAPDIVSRSFSITQWETTVGTILANDEGNVVLEYGSTNVTGNSWENITHAEMCTPVVVTSSRNNVAGLRPAIPRANNKLPTSFDLKVDNQLSDIPAGQTTTMDYIVVNAWVHNLIDDAGDVLHIQAGTENTNLVFWNRCRINNGVEVLFSPNFLNTPSVIHSVSSNNQALSIWSSAVGNTGSFTQDPNTAQMWLMLQSAHGSCSHAAEDIDYIASEPGHFTFNWVELDTIKSADIVKSVTSTWDNVSFFRPFSSIPQTILTSMLWIDGANGGTAHVHIGWAVTTTTFPATIEEDDDVVTTSRNHTTEPVGVFAFENPSWQVTQAAVLNYRISGWVDASNFSINTNTWEITTLWVLPAWNYSIDVEVCDDHCNSQCNTQSIDIEINSINDSPTDISLSSNNLDENVPVNTTVWTFSTTDLDTGDTHSYSLVPGTWDTDNSAFSISGNTLSINTSPDFETQSSYSIRVETNDGNGWVFEEVFTITINDLDEVAPVITATNFLSGTLLPGGNHEINISYNDDDSWIDVSSATITLQKWDGISTFWPDISASGITPGVINTTSASYNTSTLEFGRYRYVFNISDNTGNTTTETLEFYIDEIEFLVSTPEIDIGDLSIFTNSFSPTVEITIRTVGAPFELFMNADSFLSFSTENISSYNGTTGFWYQNTPFSWVISAIWVDESIGTQVLDINTNGERNTYVFEIQLWAIVTTEQGAWDYEWKIDFWITLNY